MPAPARRTAQMLATALVVLVLVELGVRARDDRLPTPETWYHPSAQVKVEQMDDIAESGERRPLVMVGTSQMAMGVDPGLLDAELSGDAASFNAALLAGYPEVTRRFVPEEVVPRLDPEVVVLGVSHLDLLESSTAPYTESLATSGSGWKQAERWLGERSVLVRHRDALRDLTSWAVMLSVEDQHVVGNIERYRQDVIGPDGVWRYPRPGSCDSAPDPGDQEGLAIAAGGERPDEAQEVDPAHEAAIWETVELLQARGIVVVVALLPLPDCHFEGSGPSPLLDEARQRFEAGAAARGATWIDVTEQVTDDRLFHDTGHLNEDGAARFTMLLAAALEVAGVAPDA